MWPTDDERPRPFIRTREWERRLRLAFGSCRLGASQPTSVTSPWSAEVERTGIDALWAYSKALQRGDVEHPDALLLLGDQVYADEVSPATAAFIKARRDTTRPPYEEIANFEEYTRLYRESWSDPDIRWLLSTVPSVMIFDDHDVRDDWNISWRWLEEIRNEDWWDDRITGAFMSYWLYQHLGNLSPPNSSKTRCSGSCSRNRTPARDCASTHGNATASRQPAAGPTTATSGTRGSSSSIPVRPACSPTSGGRWSTRRSGLGWSITHEARSTIS